MKKGVLIVFAFLVLSILSFSAYCCKCGKNFSRKDQYQTKKGFLRGTYLSCVDPTLCGGIELSSYTIPANTSAKCSECKKNFITPISNPETKCKHCNY